MFERHDATRSCAFEGVVADATELVTCGGVGGGGWDFESDVWPEEALCCAGDVAGFFGACESGGDLNTESCL